MIKKNFKIFLRELIYIFSKILVFVVKFIPYDFIVNLGGKLSVLYFKVSKDRNDVIKHLKIAFPDKSEKEILDLKKEFSIHIGKTFIEFLKLASKEVDFDKRCEIEGKEYLIEALQQNKGVLLLTGHIGNWELFGSYLAHLNYTKINVVAKKIYYDKLNNLLINIRKISNVNTLMRNESTKDMIKCLKNNECLGILIDQDTNVKSCFVDFFGKECSTPIGATVFAMHYDSIVLPVFISRIENNRHKMMIKKPIDLVKTSDSERDIIVNTQNFTKIIEDQIKMFPAQWVWMHKRWKRKRDNIK